MTKHTMTKHAMAGTSSSLNIQDQESLSIPAPRRTKSFSGPWDNYMLSPSTRTVSPATIYRPHPAKLYSYPHDVKMSSESPALIYDFGLEVGGIVSLDYASTGRGKIGLAFSETKTWVGPASDGSNGTYHDGGDGALITSIFATENGKITVPERKQRGGFRYLTVFADTESSHTITITTISLNITFQPTWTNLRAYGGYFYCSDDLLNRIWYAGAYTLQTNAIPPYTGRVFPLLHEAWDNSAYLGTPGASIFIDGSKRDRATWAGDLLMALPSAFVSTGDYESARNALQLQYNLQKPSGELPMAGPPLNFFGSDTYHMSSLIGTYDYILYSNDIKFLKSNWLCIKRAITFIANKIDHTGLLNVTGSSDWGRSDQGGHNTEANALMYGTLATGCMMASWMQRPDLGVRWMEMADKLKSAANSAGHHSLWDEKVGAFKDSSHCCTPYLHPQDGNSLALYYGLAAPSHSANISSHLVKNWTPIGALCPELPNNICPFIESMEIKGHLAIYQTTRALELMRLSWGWYLNNPDGTGSTCVEGYLADGSWGYRAVSGYGGDYSYTSHAHGWSTGPTHALSTFVVGLQLLSPGGSSWQLAPQFGDLEFAEGGFTTGLGKFSASWTLSKSGYSLEYDVPSGTSGSLILPGFGNNDSDMSGLFGRVEIDGEVVVSASWKREAEMGTATLGGQAGGRHTIVVLWKDGTTDVEMGQGMKEGKDEP